jgi:lysophospholipase L1-like esterase
MDLLHIRPIDTIFLGDSLTESFDLLRHFGRDDLINRGISGNLTDHVIYRMEEIAKAKPARVFLMIGINDLFSGQSGENIFENIKTIVEFFAAETPATRLMVQSILPVNVTRLFEDEGINLEIYALNRRLEQHFSSKPGLTFIDLHSDFLNDRGELDNAYTIDGVHLNARGYAHWAGLLEKFI